MSGPARYPITPPRQVRLVHRRAPLKPPRAPYRSLAPHREQRQDRKPLHKRSPQGKLISSWNPPRQRAGAETLVRAFTPDATGKITQKRIIGSCKAPPSVLFPVTSASNFPSAKSLSLLKFVDDAVTCRCNDLRPVTASGPAGVDSIWATLRWSCGRPEQFG
jgi:hypothetical protein